MTDQERMKIDVLRKQGLGYKKIAANVGLSLNTVKSYCKSHACRTFVEKGKARCTACTQPWA